MDSDRRLGERPVDEPRVVAGRYRLLAPLGSGGMGTVWRAEDSVLGREVAVKEVLFPPGLPEDEREVLRERTRREARAAARLDHPSAVTVYDVVQEHGAPFLVMELVEARTLSEVVRSEGPLTPERTAQVGLAVLGALQAAHARGIVHRDVKPGNVLLRCGNGTADRVVLTDFGIATSSGDASITSTGLLLGSPSYIAPERARGYQPGPPSDLWSLGATLFTAVEGRPPFDAGDALATVAAVVTGEHAPFVAAGPLEPVLEGLLERDPDSRLDAARAAEMLDAVARGTAAGAGTRALARPASAAAGRRTDRTAALPIGRLHEELPDDRDQPRPLPARAHRVGPPARPARPVPRQPDRRRTAVPVLLSLLLLVAAMVGGASLLGDGDPSGSRDPGSSTAADGSSDDADPAVPEGWVEYVDPQEGWALHHPPGWVVSDRNTLKQFRDQQTRRTLRVDYSTDPAPSALQAWQEASPRFAEALNAYRQVRLEPVEFRGLDAADLEFTYTDDGTDLHVLDRTFIVDGEAFALYWQVPAEGFTASLEQFEEIAATFRPNA